MFSWWIFWRFVKFLGVSLFAWGVFGATQPGDPGARSAAARQWGTAGFLLTWLAGYGLAKLSGTSLGAPWISASMLTSMLALAGALAAARSDGRVARFVAGAAAMATLGLMTSRMQGGFAVFAALVVPLAAGLWLAREKRPASPARAHPDPAETRWFFSIARAEGISLLLLFGLYMPLKYVAKIQLDGGQGWFGWVHGVLLVLFLVALFHVGWGRWSRKRMAWAFAASMVPFGTFVFERRQRLPRAGDDAGAPSA